MKGISYWMRIRCESKACMCSSLFFALPLSSSITIFHNFAILFFFLIKYINIVSPKNKKVHITQKERKKVAYNLKNNLMLHPIIGKMNILKNKLIFFYYFIYILKSSKLIVKKKIIINIAKFH